MQRKKITKLRLIASILIIANLILKNYLIGFCCSLYFVSSFLLYLKQNDYRIFKTK